MTLGRATHPDHWAGCVLRVETGVAVVLTDEGEVRASFGGRLLGDIARDRSRAPGAGDWVLLHGWCDDRITIESCLAARPSTVISLDRRRH